MCHVSRRRPSIFRRRTEYYLELERGRVKFLVALSNADERAEKGGGAGAGAPFDPRLALIGIGLLDERDGYGHGTDGDALPSARGSALSTLPPSLFERPATALGIPGLSLPGIGQFHLQGGLPTGRPASSGRGTRGGEDARSSPGAGSRFLSVAPMKALASARRRVSPRSAPRRRIELMLGGAPDGPQCGLVIGNATEGAFRGFDTAHAAAAFQRLAAAGFGSGTFVGRGSSGDESGRAGAAAAPSTGPAGVSGAATAAASADPRSPDAASAGLAGVHASRTAGTSAFPQPLEISVRRSAPDGSGPRKLDVLAPPSGPDGWTVGAGLASTRLSNVEPRWNDSLNVRSGIGVEVWGSGRGTKGG